MIKRERERLKDRDTEKEEDLFFKRERERGGLKDRETENEEDSFFFLNVLDAKRLN